MTISIACSACAISPNFGEVDLGDFNRDFGKNSPLSPTYGVEQIGTTFVLTMHQGAIFIAEGNTRWELLRQAAEVIAHDVCAKLNSSAALREWKKFGDSGWVHLQTKFDCKVEAAPRQIEDKRTSKEISL